MWLEGGIDIPPAGSRTNPSSGVVVCQSYAVETAQIDGDSVLNVGSAGVVRVSTRLDRERRLAGNYAPKSGSQVVCIVWKVAAFRLHLLVLVDEVGFLAIAICIVARV